jgi:hypothetical protein
MRCCFNARLALATELIRSLEAVAALMSTRKRGMTAGGYTACTCITSHVHVACLTQAALRRRWALMIYVECHVQCSCSVMPGLSSRAMTCVSYAACLLLLQCCVAPCGLHCHAAWACLCLYGLHAVCRPSGAIISMYLDDVGQ